ncbi:MAG: hypothetical protein RSB76_00225 [Clostridia bacterium]
MTIYEEYHIIAILESEMTDMAKNASSGSSNRNSPSMKFNKTNNFKNNVYQNDKNKASNFLKGRQFGKPFKNT